MVDGESWTSTESEFGFVRAVRFSGCLAHTTISGQIRAAHGSPTGRLKDGPKGRSMKLIIAALIAVSLSGCGWFVKPPAPTPIPTPTPTPAPVPPYGVLEQQTLDAVNKLTAKIDAVTGAGILQITQQGETLKQIAAGIATLTQQQPQPQPQPPQPVPPYGNPQQPVHPPKYGTYTGEMVWGNRATCVHCNDEFTAFETRGVALGFSVGTTPNCDVWERVPTQEQIDEWGGEPYTEIVDNGRVIGHKLGFDKTRPGDFEGLVALHPMAALMQQQPRSQAYPQAQPTERSRGPYWPPTTMRSSRPRRALATLHYLTRCPGGVCPG
jgi:hypothetical protein